MRRQGRESTSRRRIICSGQGIAWRRRRNGNMPAGQVQRRRMALAKPEELLGKYGWFSGNSLSKSHPVGQLKPNDFGLFDMHGNAWEWCDDVYEPGMGGASLRVFRGGSWNDDAADLPGRRSASRSSRPTGSTTSACGWPEFPSAQEQGKQEWPPGAEADGRSRSVVERSEAEPERSEARRSPSCRSGRRPGAGQRGVKGRRPLRKFSGFSSIQVNIMAFRLSIHDIDS